MIKRYRTILFFLFCFLFILIGVFAVLYSQGYALDLNLRSGKIKIVKTGAIFVETNLGDAEIYVSEKFKGKTGMIFKNAFKKNLIPKTYKIELKKERHWPWTKNLEIKEKLTTEIKNVILLPKDPEKQLILVKNVQKFFVSPDEKKIAYLPIDEKLEVFNVEGKNTQPILEAGKIDWILWTANSRNLFLRTWAGQKPRYFIWQENSTAPLDLDKIIGDSFNPVEFKWHPKDSTQIYFLNQRKNVNSLYKIGLLSGTVSSEIIKNTRNYEISDEGIYFFDKSSGLLFKTDFEGKSREQLTLLPLPNYNEETEYKIFVLGPKIGLRDHNNDFYLFNLDLKTFEKAGENIKSAELSKDSKKLLYFGQNEIWILYLEDVLIQPFKYKGDKELIGRFSSPIENVFWYPDDEHLIISIQNTAKIIELDGRDIRNTVDFLTGEQIYYGKSEKKIYFLDSGKLYSVKL